MAERIASCQRHLLRLPKRNAPVAPHTEASHLVCRPSNSSTRPRVPMAAIPSSSPKICRNRRVRSACDGNQVERE